MKNNSLFIIGTLTIFLALLVPKLVQNGMFLDGITYASISKNLANGIGTYWSPQYTKVLYPLFAEHPPLVFIIESFFFKLFGSHFLTERIFTFLTAILTGIAIILCWRLINEDNKRKDNYWFPVLLWLLVPIVTWSYKNNLLENAMSVFTTFSVFYSLKALKENKIYLIPISGVLILFAFLSKGFVGLFPIATPLLYGFLFDKKKQSIIHLVYLILTLSILSLSIIYLIPEITDNILRYIEQQLLPALKDQREITTQNRFYLIIDLLTELTIPIGLLIYLGVSTKMKNLYAKMAVNKNFLLFFLVAISASIPLIISLKQRKFYLLPSIPFYALAFGSLLHDFIIEKLEKLPTKFFKWLKRFVYLCSTVVVIFTITKFGDFSRDEDKIKDVTRISEILDEGTIISCTSELWSDWTLVAYFCRIGYISLDCDNEHDYLLIKNGDEIPINYQKIKLIGSNLTLLKKNTESINEP